MQKARNTAELKAQIVFACQRLWQRGLVANHDGNVSFRLPDGRIIATPTAFSKADVTAADILLIDQTGKGVEGPHKVFSEISWHLAIYRVRPDVSCVVHGHPPVAGGFGLAGKEIGTPALPEAIVSLGRHILNTRFTSPLDPELGKPDGAVDLEIKRVLNESDAFMVPGNGAWAVGQDIMQTYYRLELVEQIAKQHQIAESLGGVHRLPDLLVEDLLKRRPAREVRSSVVPPGASPIDRERLAGIVREELSGLLKSQF